MILPELLFQDIVTRGLREGRRSKKFVFQLFRNAPQQMVEQFWEALRTKDISFRFEFPRENPEFPMIWLNMISDDEEESVLGEVLGWGHGADGKVLSDGVQYPNVGLPNAMFYDSSNPLTGDAVDSGDASNIVGEGTAINDGVYPTDVANASSDSVIGEPAKIFDVAPDATGRVPVFENIGQGYKAAYSLTILDTDEVYTLFLYNLIRASINRYRTLLEDNGVISLSMSGTDFGGDPDLIPSGIFARSIQLSFLYFFEQLVEPDIGKAVKIEVVPVVEGEEADRITVLDPDITLTSVTPGTGSQGSTVTGVVVAGLNIHNGATVEITGDDLSLANAEYINGNRIRFDVTIDATATLSSRDVTVTNPDGQSDTLTGGFTVTT